MDRFGCGMNLDEPLKWRAKLAAMIQFGTLRVFQAENG
jgi:hypothetical protein